MEIRDIQGVNREWDDFVSLSSSGTIFHLTKFLSYHPSDRFIFKNLMVEHNDDIVAVLPGGIRNTEEMLEFVSPMGSSFGGIVLADGLRSNTIEDIITTIKSYLLELGCDSIHISLPPAFVYPELDIIQFLLLEQGFEVHRTDLTSVTDLIHITLKEDELQAKEYHKSANRSIRKNKKLNHEIVINSSPSSFYPVLMANQQGVHDSTPTHTEEELKTLINLLPGDFEFELVKLETGEFAAGVMIIYLNQSSAMLFYIADDPDYRDIGGLVGYLFAHVLARLKENGIQFVDFGTVSDMNGLNHGLHRFKSKFGTHLQTRVSLIYRRDD